MSSGAPAIALRPRGRRSRARAGDPEAFAALYAKHEQELFRYCRSILRSEEDARDALQNTMVKAFAALQTERRDLALRPWLFRIAHNEAISLIRRQPATAPLDEALGGAGDTVERTVETRERLTHLRADLQDLPERQRGALVMRELSGLSHEQIGEALGTSARAVKQTLYEARSSLSDCAEGRAMDCDAVQRALSDGDGRVSRSRRMRAHLRTCRACERFRDGIERRPADLAALSPVLPLLGAPGILAALKGGSVLGGAAGGTAAAVSAGAGGGGFAGSLLAAGTAKVAVVAATITVAGGAAVVIGTSGREHASRGAGPSGAPVATGATTGTAASTVTRTTPATGTTAAPAAPSGGAPVLRPGTSTAAGGVTTTASRSSAGGGTVTTGGTAGGGSAATADADVEDAAQTDRAAAKDASKADRAAAKDASKADQAAKKADAATKKAQEAAAKKRAAAAKDSAKAAKADEQAQAAQDAKAQKADAAAKAAKDSEAAAADAQDGTKK